MSIDAILPGSWKSEWIPSAQLEMQSSSLIIGPGPSTGPAGLSVEPKLKVPGLCQTKEMWWNMIAGLDARPTRFCVLCAGLGLWRLFIYLHVSFYILDFDLSLLQLFIMTWNSYAFSNMLMWSDSDARCIVRKTGSTFFRQHWDISFQHLGDINVPALQALGD